jgi:hypothetical protein
MMHAAEDAADEIQADHLSIADHEGSANRSSIIKWDCFDSYLVLSNLLERAQEMPIIGAVARRLIHEQVQREAINSIV